jgi:hypothetical protein
MYRRGSPAEDRATNSRERICRSNPLDRRVLSAELSGERQERPVHDRVVQTDE